MLRYLFADFLLLTVDNIFPCSGRGRIRAYIRKFVFYLLLVDPIYLYLDIDSGGIRSYRVRENLQSFPSLRLKGIQYYISQKK